MHNTYWYLKEHAWLFALQTIRLVMFIIDDPGRNYKYNDNDNDKDKDNDNDSNNTMTRLNLSHVKEHVWLFALQSIN